MKTSIAKCVIIVLLLGFVYLVQSDKYKSCIARFGQVSWCEQFRK